MSIFTHVMVGSNDLEKSKQFYNAVMTTLGIDFLGEFGGNLAYGKGAPQFVCGTPRDGQAASYANGGTIGFAAADKATVEAFHQAALSNGGNGDSGPEYSSKSPNVFGSWVRDPDGNKICAICLP